MPFFRCGAAVVDVDAVLGEGDVFREAIVVAEELFHCTKIGVSVSCEQDCWPSYRHYTPAHACAGELFITLQSVQGHEWFGAEWCDGCHSRNIHVLSEHISYVRAKYIGLVHHLSIPAADGRTCEVFFGM